jgi:hypothetical protein
MSAPVTNERLLAALAYARRGWSVFPCRPRDKRPATRNGFKDGTVDKGRIVAGWTRAPLANVAIVTGVASGVIVLDVDPRNGGNESLAELERRYGELPETPTVRTGGGGHHYYFAALPGSHVKSRKVADGLDLKADGGYILAPPSVHPSGGVYAWSRDFQRTKLVPCPPWLLAGPPGRRERPADAADSPLGGAFKRAGMLGRVLDGGKRAVTCPWEEQHTTGKRHDSSTVIFPPESPGTPGGFHCSHSHCAGRTVAHVLRAVAARSTDENDAAPWMLDLRRSDRGEIRPTFGNTVLLLSHDPGYSGRLKRDEMRGVVLLGAEEVTDAAISEIRVDLEKRFEITPRDSDVAKAVELVAARNGFHPVRDFLQTLRWDGVRRLDSIVTEVLCAPAETEDERALLTLLVRKWFLALVARPFDPGCKVDTALILQGAQGVGKSSFFREIAGDHFSDTEMALDKDAMMQLRGAWIYEWAELENVTGRQEVARVKAFLTSREDRYRPPFGRATVTVRRSGLIVGTTNREDFLCDPSGSRRFWVVPVGRIDVARLRREREQLLAEAVVAHKGGEPWWLTEAEELARAKLAARFADVDAWEADVLEYAGQHGDVRTRDILVHALHFSLDRIDRRADMRVANILRRNGYVPRQLRVEGQKGRYWCRADG